MTMAENTPSKQPVAANEFLRELQLLFVMQTSFERPISAPQFIALHLNSRVETSSVHPNLEMSSTFAFSPELIHVI